MYCIKCGVQLPDESRFCNVCGASLIEEKTEIAPAPAAQDKSRTLGLISMILGIVSVGTQLIQTGDVVALPAAIAALILAYISRSRNTLGKKFHPYAKTGMICGYVGVGMYILSLIVSAIVLALYFIIIFAEIFADHSIYYSM